MPLFNSRKNKYFAFNENCIWLDKLRLHALNGYACFSVSVPYSYQLRRDIQKAGYSFKSILSYFVKNKDTEPEDVTHKTFVIFCEDLTGTSKDIEDLEKFCEEMSNNYNQEPYVIFNKNNDFVSCITDYIKSFETEDTVFEEAYIEDYYSVADRTCRHYMGEIF